MNHEPIYEPHERDRPQGRFRFVPYIYGTRQGGQENRSFGVWLYVHGKLSGYGSSVHSFYMAAQVARDHYRGGVCHA